MEGSKNVQYIDRLQQIGVLALTGERQVPQQRAASAS
jgi:hypothetical protein